TYDVFAVFSRQGTMQGQQCVAPPRWVNFCREGASSADDDPCIFSQPHVITPASSPPPAVGPYVAQVLDGLRAAAGTIGSLPTPYGLVNLPTCFWIHNIGVPAERDLTPLP